MRSDGSASMTMAGEAELRYRLPDNTNDVEFRAQQRLNRAEKLQHPSPKHI